MTTFITRNDYKEHKRVTREEIDHQRNATKMPLYTNILLTLPMLWLLSSKAQGRKIFQKHLNPVMLVFIG